MFITVGMLLVLYDWTLAKFYSIRVVIGVNDTLLRGEG